jgi:hypothetical protein
MLRSCRVDPCPDRPKSLARVLKLVTKRRKCQLLSTVEELPRALRTEASELLVRAPRASALGLEPLTPGSEEFFRQMVTLRVPDNAPEDLQQRL